MKGYPIETRKFYDATIEVHSRHKMTLVQIENELIMLKKNGYNNAVKGVELALEELKIRNQKPSIYKYG